MIDTKLLVKFVLNEVSSQKQEELWQYFKKNTDYIGVLDEIKSECQEHGFTTSTEYLKWSSANSKSDLAEFGLFSSQDIALQELIEEVQEILADQFEIDKTSSFENDKALVYDGETTDITNNVEKLFVLMIKALKDGNAAELLNRISKKERRTLLGYFMKKIIDQVAMEANIPKSSIDRTSLIQEINICLEGTKRLVNYQLKMAVETVLKRLSDG